MSNLRARIGDRRSGLFNSTKESQENVPGVQDCSQWASVHQQFII